ncbi:hypothetical protein O6H91_05G109300 [Diphasiastrum complanatum]|uniref:Uncharacterized protein n=2 Tax=Diphasiastrum complanatum TaxID=34168 RepID=A0ACC2DSB6_DIPCM|nr:hypothetical protein O6H91_05G061200 [Diphasiastrum complanatum]KAJ7557033.1 hypothetical protein O6H91_05G109300 [Diphasiastrum complanatum]
MVDWWWGILGAAIPAALVRQLVVKAQQKRGQQQQQRQAPGDRKASDGADPFVCERVCTSKRMLKRVGAYSRDNEPDTCVTVCGASAVDACVDACSRTVCLIPHHVPNWNDICIRRCQNQCLKSHQNP